MSGYQDQNADERTRDNDEIYQDTHDRDAERADESRGNFFADSIFELAKSSTAAYQAAYREGYNAGYSAAVQAAVSIIDRKVTK